MAREHRGLSSSERARSGFPQVLLRAGFGVRGFDVWPPAVEKFAAAGGATATDVKSCAAGADALVLMVVSADQAEDVLFGEQHAGASALPRGSVVILCSTVAPEAARALAARLAAEGLAFVDAPVSGGVARAADGALTIMASGDEHAMAKASSCPSSVLGLECCLPSCPRAGLSARARPICRRALCWRP